MNTSERLTVIDDRLDHLEKRVDQGFAAVDERFEQVDKRFEQVDERFKEVGERFKEVGERFKQVDKHFDEQRSQFHAMQEASMEQFRILYDLIKSQGERMDHGFAQMNVKFDTKIADIHAVLKDHARRLLVLEGRTIARRSRKR